MIILIHFLVIFAKSYKNTHQINFKNFSFSMLSALCNVDSFRSLACTVYMDFLYSLILLLINHLDHTHSSTELVVSVYYIYSFFFLFCFFLHSDSMCTDSTLVKCILSIPLSYLLVLYARLKLRFVAHCYGQARDLSKLCLFVYFTALACYI